MPGGAPGLQSQCGAEKVPGGFDSHSPPPFLLIKEQYHCCKINTGKIPWPRLKSNQCCEQGPSALMNIQKRKTFIACLILIGVLLLAWGLLFGAREVFPKQIDSTPTLESETTLIKNVTFGGIIRDQYGNIRKTYSGKPPKACPT